MAKEEQSAGIDMSLYSKSLRKANDPDAMGIKTIPGFHACEVPKEDAATYTAMGVHLARRDEGVLTQDYLYQTDERGLLEIGDCFIGVVTEEAKQEHDARIGEPLESGSKDGGTLTVSKSQREK
jgi:hypothetical protein